MSDTRHRLLQRLDTLEKRISKLTSADPRLHGLEDRVAEQSEEREQARGRLATLDQKLTRLTSHPVSVDSAVRESVRRHLDTRLSAVEGELQARITRKASTPVSEEAPAQERIMKRVARIESAVAAQHTAIVELRDCSLKTEETMQKLLSSVDSIVTRTLHRNSR